MYNKMVNSNVNPSVEYKETTDIEPDDLKYESFPYNIIFDTIDTINPIQVIFGQLKTTYENDGVSYFPMYFLNNKNIASQIGVLEIGKLNKLDIFEGGDGGEIIPDVKNIVLFKFATKDYLKSLDDSASESESETEPELIEESDESDDGIFSVRTAKAPVDRKSIFSVDIHKKQIVTLPEESKEDARVIRKSYNMAPSDDWIVKFMQNRNYKIQDTNDCFFASVFHAFNEIGENITVDKLRGLLADEIVDEMYQNKKKAYLEYENLLDENNRIIGGNKNSLALLKKRIKSTDVSTEERRRIVDEAKKLKDNITSCGDANRAYETFAKKNIHANFKEMCGINTLAQYQDFVRSSKHSAEPSEITLLEHLLNVKFIILSEDAHKEDSTDSVLECGNDLDARFSPNFYIIVSRAGHKYNLVSYKDKKLLTFREIPYDIKMLILNKCMERNAGNYNYIQDFRNLKSRMGIPIDDLGDGYDYAGLEHDPDIVFMISQDSASPGCGSGERIPMEKIFQYVQLAKIPKWRKKLDDSWTEAPFDLDGHRWASADNQYQAAKYKNSYPDFAVMFSIDGNSQFSKDPALAKLVGGSNKHELKPPHVKHVDKDFYGERSVKEKYNGLVAKYEQNLDIAAALLATRPAILMQFHRGKKPEVRHDLMRVRDYLASKNMR
jgi:predicted NAD-dependent protein-ADP-ribosyltransferase YbiA (DUF1768 family)